MKVSKELKVGIVSIVVILVFYWLFIFLKGKNLFTTGRVFYVEYNNVDGLLPSKPVNVNGLRVGRVDKIDIIESTDSIYFLVKLVVERDLKFTKNTVAEIYEPGIMEGKMIKLNLSYDGELAKDGDKLKAAVNESMLSVISNQFTPTKNKIDSVLVSLNQTLGAVERLADDETAQGLKNVLHRLDNTINALGQTANSITKMSDNAGSLLKNADNNLGQISENANTMLVTTNTSMEKYGNLADKLQSADIETTLNNLEKATASLESTLNRVENGDGTLNKMIDDPELYNNLNSASANLNGLLEDLKENPNRYVQFSVFGKKDKKKKDKDKE